MDLARDDTASGLLQALQPSHVFHLAGVVDTSRSLDVVSGQFRDTYKTSAHVARACAEMRVRRLVHVGSCEEYGNGPAPFLESQAPAPVSPYSAAKVAATAFVQSLCASFGLRAVVVRPALTYGPGQPSKSLIASLIDSARSGQDFPMTSGEQTRAFSFVGDIVDGLLLAAQVESASGEIINLGSPEPRRVRDVAALTLRLMGDPIRLLLGQIPDRVGEVRQSWCSIAKARAILGWEPEFSLERGLRDTIAWHERRVPALGAVEPPAH